MKYYLHLTDRMTEEAERSEKFLLADSQSRIDIISIRGWQNVAKTVLKKKRQGI